MFTGLLSFRQVTGKINNPVFARGCKFQQVSQQVKVSVKSVQVSLKSANSRILASSQKSRFLRSSCAFWQFTSQKQHFLRSSQPFCGRAQNGKNKHQTAKSAYILQISRFDCSFPRFSFTLFPAPAGRRGSRRGSRPTIAASFAAVAAALICCTSLRSCCR